MIDAAREPKSRNLTAADLEKQAHIVDARRAEIGKELEFVNQKLSECLARSKKMNARARRDGRIIDPNIVYYAEREEGDLRARKKALEEEMGRLKMVRKRLDMGLHAQRVEDRELKVAAARLNQFQIDLLVSLGKVRDRYEAFASDGTRVNSMRLMAAEFSKELTGIMREIGQTIDL